MYTVKLKVKQIAEENESPNMHHQEYSSVAVRVSIAARSDDTNKW